MKKISLWLLFLLAMATNVFATSTFDYTAVNQASAIDGATWDDFPELFPTSSTDVNEVMYRVGVTRENTAGDLYNLTYTTSTDTYTARTLLFECPNTALDATNPTKGQIGSTLYSLVNCKDTGNTVSILYMGTRAVSGAISTWSFSAVYSPGTSTANGWNGMVATSDSSTFFFPISVNEVGHAIRRLVTTNSGSSWAISSIDIVATPSKWSEGACVYVPTVQGHICLVRDDTGGRVNYVASTDGKGEVWTTPAPISSNAYGAATGVKVSTLYYDTATDTLLGIYVDRGDSNIMYAMTAKPSQAFRGEWNTPRNIGSGQGGEAITEIDSTLKKFLILEGVAGGTGGGRIDDIQYQNLLQTIRFGQIGP